MIPLSIDVEPLLIKAIVHLPIPTNIAITLKIFQQFGIHIELRMHYGLNQQGSFFLDFKLFILLVAVKGIVIVAEVVPSVNI